MDHSTGVRTWYLPEATGGFEPPIGVLQTPALTTWPRRREDMVPHQEGNGNLSPLEKYLWSLTTRVFPLPLQGYFSQIGANWGIRRAASDWRT